MTRYVPYIPAPGSVAERAIAHFRSLPAGSELTTTALAEVCGFNKRKTSRSLGPAIRNGALVVRLGSSRIAPWFWSLGNPDAAMTLRTGGHPSRTKSKPAPKPTKKAPMAVLPKARRVTSELPVVVPAGLKVTICPSALDTRYKADPSFTGGYLAEWRRLRGEA